MRLHPEDDVVVAGRQLLGGTVTEMGQRVLELIFELILATATATAPATGQHTHSKVHGHGANASVPWQLGPVM